MKRREFITLLGGAVVWPMAVRAQQRPMPVIGFLDTGSPGSNTGQVAGFRQGLKEAGYIEGQNVAIEFRWGDRQSSEGFDAFTKRLQVLAADLVRLQVAVIVASSGVGAAIAAKAATSTIPIVIAGGADPVKYGIVTSWNRPGGNVTGMTSLHNELAGKRVSLLRALLPHATTIGYLVSGLGGGPQEEQTSDMLAAARTLGLQILVLECRNNVDDLDTAFATLVDRRADAVVLSAFPLAFNNRERIVALAASHKIPAMYSQLPYIRQGGLMAYSANIIHDVALNYVAPILRGAKPSDLPIQQPTKFDLVINFMTAKALGLTIPPILLATATRVIE